MKNYFRNWNFMRVLRLALGIIVIVQGIEAKEWLLVGLGSLFSLMPLMNIGCCCTAGCNVPAPKNKKSTEEISYEEVH